MSRPYSCYLIIFLATLSMLIWGEGWAAGKTTRVSVDSSKNQGDDESGFPAISAEGRFIAFESDASNLVEGDTNGVADVFVRNQKTKMTLRVSIDSNGSQGNDSSHAPALSADGRFVAFESYASNLVEGDTNGTSDIFIHDRKTGETTRVSMDSQGNQSNGHSAVPALSADGRLVAFESHASNLVEGDTNGTSDIFVHNRNTGETTRVSVSSEGEEGDYASYAPSLSADGRFVAFESYAFNLVAAIDINFGAADIFVHDRQTGETTRVSVSSEGAQGGYSSYAPAISADGRLVAFKSLATVTA
jgi:Tol biopolymer transport system component